ncbi:MAG: hypothetical protein DMF99_31230 [Acidobacteria bacterium]|nr:MAG: hypothetical protein DMF99_31230 [Acidobacteriota bacterium]
MTGARLPQRRVVCALPCLLTLEFVGKGRQRHHDFVGRRIECALAILEIKEDAHACGDELLKA